MRKKNVSMIGNLTRDMMNDVMETALKKRFRRENSERIL